MLNEETAKKGNHQRGVFAQRVKADLIVRGSPGDYDNHEIRVELHDQAHNRENSAKIERSYLNALSHRSN